jgi:acyl-CoA thioester hydrolase
VWTEGKTFRIEQSVRKTDGTLAAELTGVGGLIDLKERRLVADPREYFRALASDPRAFGL